jgi:hypothetical protein
MMMTRIPVANYTNFIALQGLRFKFNGENNLCTPV